MDNKGRVRTGQAVHRSLLQQNFVADPDDTGVSSSTLLVHRDCPRTGGSVRRQNALQTARRVYMHRLCCLLYSTYYIVLAAAAEVVVMLMVVMAVVVVIPVWW